MTNPFEDALEGALSTRQIDHGRMKRFLEGELSASDIDEMYNPYELAEFWEEFRVLYLNANNDSELFLERLESSASGNGTTALDRGNADSMVRVGDDKESEQTKASTTIEPLPEPFVPGTGRRGSDAPRQPNAVIRTIRGIGRIFGIGRKR